MATKSNIFNDFHIGVDDVVNSRRWFAERIAEMKKGRRITPDRVLAAGHMTTSIKPGSLFLFQYDPKLKDTLPHYDMFPLVFPYKPAPGGFLGLNMHYLGYKERFALFKKLIDINGSKISDTTKIQYSWGMINSMAQMSNAKFCIKHYLNEHVASPFSKIAPNDWATVLCMPCEKFVGDTKENIWMRNR
jgi:hypothetical protein